MTIEQAKAVMVEEAIRLCRRSGGWELCIRQTNRHYITRTFDTESKLSDENWYVSVTDEAPNVDSDFKTVHADGRTLNLAVLHLTDRVTAMLEHKKQTRRFLARKKA